MEFQDYYETLGVPETATEKEIRSAFRKLARQYHPDVNPGNAEAEQRFKQINEAYEVLSDPEKRKRYDEVGSRWREYEQWQHAQQASGARAEPYEWGGFADAGPRGARYEYRTTSDEDLRDLFGDDAPFSDFFETFFRGGGARGASGQARAPRPRPGSDLEHPLEISLEDAYRGTTVQLSLQTPDRGTQRLEVKIPPGVNTGSRVRVSGKGQPGRGGGQHGDLYLVIEVRPDPRFERTGDDLRTRVPAPVSALLLGGEAHVPTPDGRRLALTIPAGTQDGRVFRLRGQGMPRLGKPDVRGDLHAEVHARLPEELTPRQRQLLEEALGSAAGTAETAGAGTR